MKAHPPSSLSLVLSLSAAIAMMGGGAVAQADEASAAASFAPTENAKRAPAVGATKVAGERPVAQLWATQPLSLLGAGLGLSYEREVGAVRQFSAAALVGLRGGAGGDFHSRTGTLGGALRWWPLASAARPMRRLGVSLHASAGLTSVTDEIMDESIGSSWTLTQRLEVSYRFVAWGHLSITPSLGAGVREDVDRTGRLATTARPVASLGFEIGWIR